MPSLHAGSIPIQAGDVIKVPAHFTYPPKEKILICVSPIAFKYLVVSSQPYALAVATQLMVTVADLPFLDHTSYIDTSKMVTLSAIETQYVVDADPNCHRGPISSALRQAIKAIVIQHGIMPKDQMRLIGQNL
jgi:hypothetical protein